MRHTWKRVMSLHCAFSASHIFHKILLIFWLFSPNVSYYFHAFPHYYIQLIIYYYFDWVTKHGRK